MSAEDSGFEYTIRRYVTSLTNITSHFLVVFFRAGYEFFCSFIGIFLTPKDKKTLHGKISIVTGAGQGIKQKI